MKYKYDLTIHNPCNHGNKIVRKDPSVFYKGNKDQYPLEDVMVKWSESTYQIKSYYTDEYTRDNSPDLLNLCGPIDIRFLALEQYPFVSYDVETETITISTEDDSLAGSYQLEATITLRDYPLATDMKLQMPLTILDREIELEESSTWWIWLLAFMFSICAGVGGFYLGKHFSSKQQSRIIEEIQSFEDEDSQQQQNGEDERIKEEGVSTVELVNQINKLKRGESLSRYINPENWEEFRKSANKS